MSMGFGGYSTKGKTFPVEILTPEEVRAILGKVTRRGACGVRDRALIATLFRAGLRISEALALYPKDVNVADGTIFVLRGKGGKSRVVAVDPEAAAMIELWIVRRASLGLTGRNPLFSTLEGGELAREQVSRKLKTLATKAGIEKRVHPHGLRHSRAVDLVKNGTSLPVIQAAYGHTSLATTQTYVSHIAPTDVIAALRGGSW